MVHRGGRFWDRRQLLRDAVTTFNLEKQSHHEACANERDNRGNFTDRCFRIQTAHYAKATRISSKLRWPLERKVA